MGDADHEPTYGKLTVAQARAMREDQALLAVSYAYRAAQARARGRRGPAAQWTAAYRQAADRCRRLGERIRGEGAQTADTAARTEAVPARFMRSAAPGSGTIRQAR